MTSNEKTRVEIMRDILSIPETVENIKSVAKCKHGWMGIVSSIILLLATIVFISITSDINSAKSLFDFIIAVSVLPFFITTFIFSGKPTPAISAPSAFVAGVAITTMGFVSLILSADNVYKSVSDTQALFDLGYAGSYLLGVSLLLIYASVIQKMVTRLLKEDTTAKQE